MNFHRNSKSIMPVRRNLSIVTTTAPARSHIRRSICLPSSSCSTRTLSIGRHFNKLLVAARPNSCSILKKSNVYVSQSASTINLNFSTQNANGDNDITALSDKTASFIGQLQTPIPSNKTQETILSIGKLMNQWQLAIDSLPINDKNKTTSRMMVTCAQQMETLLDTYIHLLTHHPSSSSSSNINTHSSSLSLEKSLPSKTWLFQQTMQAYRQTSLYNNPTAGQAAASILNKWGDMYGGDMEHAPTIDAFNVVLDAYANSIDTFSSTGRTLMDGVRIREEVSEEEGGGGGREGGRNNNENEGAEVTPAAQSVWETYAFLNQLGDVSLKPDTETCCHVIRALAAHARLVDASKRRSRDGIGTSLHGDSSNGGALDVESASRRAFVLLGLLEEMELDRIRNNAKSGKKDDVGGIGMMKGNEYYHPRETLVLQAYANVISLSQYGLLHDEDEILVKHYINYHDKDSFQNVGLRTEQLLSRMVEYYQRHCQHFIYEEGDKDKQRMERYLEEAHLSTMMAWEKEQKMAREEGGDDLLIRVCNAALAADTILTQMEDNYFDLGNDHGSSKSSTSTRAAITMTPRPDYYHAVIHSFANCFDMAPDRSGEDLEILQKLAPHERCQEIMDRMEKRFYSKDDEKNSYDNRGDETMKLPASMYGRVIWSWLQSINSGIVHSTEFFAIAEKTESILHRMIELLQHDRLSSPKGLTHAFNHVLMAYAHSGDRRAVKKSEQLFNLLKEGLNNDSSRNFVPEPDAFTYNAFLTVLSKGGTKDGGFKALSLLNEMEDAYENRKAKIKPNITHYSAVIKSLGNSKSKDSAQVAHQLLKRVESEYDELSWKERDRGNFNLTVLYSAVITAWARSPCKNAGNEAMELLNKLEERQAELKDENYKIDIIVYSSVLHALSNTSKYDKTALQKSMLLLEKLESRYRNGEQDMLPNKFCYTVLISAWSRSGEEEAPEKAHELLEKMERMYEESGDESVKPDTLAYSAVIDAWSRRRSPLAAQKAEALLYLMEDRAKDGYFSVKPNTITYTSVINSLWKSGDADAGERAEEVLKLMESKYRAGDLEAKPDAYTYTSVINAWGRSKSSEKASRAWRLLLRMKDQFENGDRDCMPNVIAITSVMNACAHSSGNKNDRSEAIRIALLAQNLLLDNQEYGTPNSITFRTLLDVFGKNIFNAKERRRFASITFERCCKEGEVDSSVLKALKKHTRDLFNNLPISGTGSISIADLPPEWSKNSRQRGK